MILKCYTHTKWKKSAIADPEKLFSTNNRKRVLATIRKAKSLDVRHEIKPLDQHFLDWFTPIYEENIGKKTNAKVYDLQAATLGKKSEQVEYWSFVLYLNNNPLGATIVGVRSNAVVAAFKFYQNSWLEESFQASPTLYADYLLAKYGYDIGKKIISHGRDRNPYGLNSNIGLATYKLSTGFLPYKPNKLDMVEIDSTKLESDTLIMLPPTDGEAVAHAQLFCSPDTEEKYTQLLGYSNVITFEIIHRR